MKEPLKQANTPYNSFDTRTLVEQFILSYGWFKELKSDREREFLNELMNNIRSLLQIKQTFSTPYGYETFGLVQS